MGTQMLHTFQYADNVLSKVLWLPQKETGKF